MSSNINDLKQNAQQNGLVSLSSSEKSEKRLEYLEWDEYFMAITFLELQKSGNQSNSDAAIILNQRQIITSIANSDCRNNKDTTDLNSYTHHAEYKALNKIQEGVTLYTTSFPCEKCAQAIVDAGILEIIYYQDNVDTDEARTVLKQGGVSWRPLSEDETQVRRQNVVKSSTSTEVVLKSGATEKKYTFDRVFHPSCTQAEVYEHVVSPLIDFVLSGYTCTVFAYGQTGTGKTHTMIGQAIAYNLDFHDPTVGIVPRAAVHIFNELAKLRITHSVRVSFVEIYNEEVRDLLVEEGVPLRVYDDPDNKGATCIRGLTETYVKSTVEVYDMLNLGAAERQTASTNLNRLSSRSHTIFTIVVNTREITSNGEEIIKTGKLHLVDLAGSENIGRSGATDMRAREAGSINKSLLTLGKVIKALALKMQHVPYRESNLTRILQDSLGGKSKTSMIATFTPSMECFDETVSTLDYAHVARSVANCPTMNINKTQTSLFKASQDELLKLRQELKAARSGDGFFMSSDSHEKVNQAIKAKNERILILIQQIEGLERHIITKQSEYDSLQESFRETESTAQEIANQVNEQIKKIRENEYIANHIEGQFLQLKDTASTLLDVAENATKHEDVYYNKYEAQCSSTMLNATVADKITKTSVTSLGAIDSASDKFHKKTTKQVDDCLNRLQILKENQDSDVQKMNVVADGLRSTSERAHLTLDNLFRDGAYSKDKIESDLKSSSNYCFQKVLSYVQNVRNKVKDIKEITSEKRAHVEALTRNYQKIIEAEVAKDMENNVALQNLNESLDKCCKEKLSQLQRRLVHVRKIRELRAQLIIKETAKRQILAEELENIDQMRDILKEMRSRNEEDSLQPILNVKAALIKFEAEVQPLMSDVSSSVMTKIKSIRDEKENCLKKIGSSKTENREYLAKFAETFESELQNLQQEGQTNLLKWAHDLTQIRQNMLRDQEQVDYVNTGIGAVAHEDKTYENDTAQFVQQTSEKLQRLEENLDSKVHAGDTPVKPVYKYPNNVESGSGVEALQLQFDALKEEVDEDTDS